MPKFSKKRARAEEDEGSDSGAAAAPAKKTKSAAKSETLGHGKDADGNKYWELSSKRRVTISQWKTSTLVNIREFWEAPGGELKPGKKGISLSVEQYEELLKAAPAINAELRKKGHNLEGLDGAADAAAKDVDEPMTTTSKKKEKASARSNIDATSDEESS